MKMWCLLIAVAIIAVALVWLVDQPKRRGKAIATAKRVGGFVQLDGEYEPEILTPSFLEQNWFSGINWPGASPNDRFLFLHRFGLVRWSDKWLGPEFAHDLSVVSLDGQRISDDDLTKLEKVASLRRLYLNGTPITDAGMAHLDGLSGLEILELRETKIGDAGLHHLARLPQLRALYLYETRVGDAGMASLARLRNLDELSLGHTAVGDAGLAHLAGLTRLKFLKLGKTHVTDAGLVTPRRAQEAGIP